MYKYFIVFFVISNSVYSEDYSLNCISKIKSYGIWLDPKPCQINVSDNGDIKTNKLRSDCFTKSEYEYTNTNVPNEWSMNTSVEITRSKIFLYNNYKSFKDSKFNIGDTITIDLFSKEWNGFGHSPFGSFQYWGKCS